MSRCTVFLPLLGPVLHGQTKCLSLAQLTIVENQITSTRKQEHLLLHTYTFLKTLIRFTGQQRNIWGNFLSYENKNTRVVIFHHLPHGLPDGIWTQTGKQTFPLQQKSQKVRTQIGGSKSFSHRKRMTDLDNREVGVPNLLHCRTPNLVLFSRVIWDGKALKPGCLTHELYRQYLD